ncbi:MAG TPA: hypothetical protein VE643_06835 [Nitrososphaeraceae archaeon]|nr:hypothetical protein [Nitrososphaeraceae archaeon]
MKIKTKFAFLVITIISLSILIVSEQHVFASNRGGNSTDSKGGSQSNIGANDENPEAKNTDAGTAIPDTGTVDNGTSSDVPNDGTTPQDAGTDTGNTVLDNGTDTGTTPSTTPPNSTGPNGGLIVNGNCNAVALSDATNNSSAASSAAVTCNNSVVNKNIYQQRITQTLPQIQSAIANKGPIIQSDNMKLGQYQKIESNDVIVVGDFSPFRIVGGHISANLPKGNDTQIVVGEISTTGVLSKAIPLPLVKARSLTINDTLYTTDLGNIVQGRDIFNGNRVTINSPNIIMLYNVGKVVTFSGANTIAYTAIIA